MDGLLRDAVMRAIEATRLPEVVTVDPVGVGASNDVYYVTTVHGEFVARAALRTPDGYHMEQLVTGWVQARGVPAPVVIDVGTVDEVSVMISERLSGKRLADNTLRHARRFAEQCGEVLAAIHSVPTSGFGNLTPDGRGVRQTLDAWFIDDLVPVLREGAAVGGPDVHPVLDRLAAVVERARPALLRQPGGLTHGDFSPMNLLVDGRGLTGIVDWESAKSGPPAFDFGWWDWYSTHTNTPFSADDMITAYRHHRTVDLDELAELRRLVVLRVMAAHLAWAAQRDDQQLVANAVATLTRTKLI